ncbi:Transport and Golgi organization 10 [Carabus blaptoides fortunei]
MFGSNKPNIAVTPTSKKMRYKEGLVNNKDTYEMKVDDSNIILERIKQLHREQLMTDVTLVVAGRDYPAHRLMLCLSSDVFQVMLMKPEWSEWHESRIILQEPEQCASVFPLFLEYFYSGQITLTHLNVMPILALADKYNVKNLTNICVSYMCSNVAYAAVHNKLISWLQYTLACGHNDVSRNCQNFVKWNLETISQTEDFGHFDAEVFISLLQQNDLVIENEMALYQCAVKWLNYQNNNLKQEGHSETSIEEHMKTLTEQVMTNIRFPMMSPRKLAELLLSPLINKYKEFFVERMAIGMIFHSGQEDRIQNLYQNENGKLLFTPRLYTAEHFSSLLQIDNFLSTPSYGTHTFMFSSHMNLAEYEGDYVCDWIVDVYPKGVWFKKFFLIVWQGTIEIPECVIPTVRISVTCKNIITQRVKVAVLIYGEKDGIEHVIRVIERVHTFTSEESMAHIAQDSFNISVSVESALRRLNSVVRQPIYRTWLLRSNHAIHTS